MSPRLTGYLRPQSAAHRDATTKQPRLYGSLGAAGLLQFPFPFAANLVAYWRMEDNGNDALGVFNAEAVGSVAYAAGKNNKALSLAGAGYLNAGISQQLNPAEMTVNLWINYVGSYTYKAAAGRWPGSNNSWAINAHDFAAGKPGIWLATTDNANVNVAATRAINDGAWHMLTMTHNQTVARLYVDGGAEIVSVAAAVRLNPAGSATTIGSTAGTSGRIIADIDEVAILNRALSPAEIVQLYNAGAGIFY